MKRRWLIRLGFLLPLLLSLGGWLWSAAYCVQVEFSRHTRFVNCGTYFGTVFIHCGRQSGLPDHCNFAAIPQEPLRILHPYNPDMLYCWGFGFQHASGTWGHFTILTIPYWFLLPLAAAVLFIAWRKTAQPKPHRAFPVEVPAKGQQT